MDTKWKNRKKGISFLVFFLGISLALGNIAAIFRDRPSGVRIWQLQRLLQDDYQESGRFRAYMTHRLEDFLIMATGGEGLWGIWGYADGTYYGGYDRDYYYSDYGDYYGDYYEEYWNGYTEFQEAVREMGYPQEAEEDSADSGSVSSMSVEELADYLEGLEKMQDDYLELLDMIGDSEQWDSDQMEDFRYQLEDYRDGIEYYLGELQSYRPELDRERMKPLTEEQKQIIARKYHERIQGDKNLLYTVAYDGKALYSNSDFLPADGSMAAPEGYDFVLYFDGEKVRIQKDGKEVDIYGDGYYRDDSDWYLPGYRNFQVDETAKKAAVCIAVAKEPVLFSEGAYGNGGTKQYDNTLYWMDRNFRDRQRNLIREFKGLAIGIVLLFAAFLCRKSRQEAAKSIARFQARIWMECKLVVFLLFFYGVYLFLLVFLIDGSGYSLREEMADIVPPLLWVALFWGIWLLWNDLRHNKKIWRRSLIAELYRTFSAKSLNQPLARKIARRNRTVFLTSLVYGALMTGEFLLIYSDWRDEGIRIAVLFLVILETVLFLTALYLTGAKNMKAAREVDVLSGRIAQIRNGDYRDRQAMDSTGVSANNTAYNDAGWPRNVEESAGQNLEPVMAQLEDIRHGMAKAVDEQMKSERMKVELIANVSHDIKTPLTSIISYVEILKQEEGLPDYVKDYIRILDEKSHRLKNMVQDVFAVSKAASGELPVQMEELDFGKLLRQTLADMEEQIADSDVTFRTEIPEEPVMIMADGERLYRVFQNLFQNAIKYSLEGSRVYITLRTDGQLAVASVKNTSRQELEKEKDFAERFARGDASRTDGGSGLGLSIAQSFTEACGGQFSWETDADLFVVKIAFRILRPYIAPKETAQ